jgi:DNA repair exonuclease SbcCD nuclease subunit
MAASSYQILCTGDLHLGRRPARVPIDDDRLSVRHVWESLVDAAIDRQVDAVVLTGDVVDAENKMYEAYGTLERGLRSLLDAGVHVVAVAGNHDYDAFPRLVRSVDDERFHLLGRGGTWGAVELPRSGEAPVRLVGWSFPEATVTRNPVQDLGLSDAEGPTLGVIHCDAGRRDGRYAPVPRPALARAPVDAWLLGHIHAPADHREDGQLQLYPGSPQPLDPGEPGTHGPWLVAVATSGVDAQQLPMATLRYDTVSVDVAGMETAGDVDDAVLRALQGQLADVAEAYPTVRHLAARLRFVGRTRLHQQIDDQARQIVRDLRTEVDGTVASVEGYRIDARPDYNLRDLADGNDPTGVLAQLLLDLEAGKEMTGEEADLVRSVDKAVEDVHTASGYEPLRRDSETRDAPERDELRDLLRRQGYRLLDELVAQRR